MKDKLIFLDTETTGLDEKDQDGYTLLASETHSIVEFAAIVDINGKIAGRTEIVARPWEDDEIDPKSVEINGLTIEEIQKYPPQSDLLRSIKEFLEQFVDPFDKEDKLWIVAYNADFDVQFLRNLWYRHDDPYFGSYFWTPPIDIMQLVAFSILGEGLRPSFPNFKLSTVSSKFGIQVAEDKVHSAMYDARLCRQIFYKIYE